MTKKQKTPTSGGAPVGDEPIDKPTVKVAYDIETKRKRTTPTLGGVPVTDDLVEELAAEAEAGYDVEVLRRRGGRRPMGSGLPMWCLCAWTPNCGLLWLNGPRLSMRPLVT
jgi:hypothetical protein